MMLILLLSASVLVGSVFAAPIGSECGCFGPNYAGKFDIKISKSPIQTVDFTDTRIAGFFDVDMLHNTVFFNIWNANYYTGVKSDFAFDFTLDLPNKYHMQLVPEGGKDCLNIVDKSKQVDLSKLKNIYDFSNDKSRCFLRNGVKNETVGDSIVYDVDVGKVFYDAKTCQMTKATFGSPDSSYYVEFTKDKSGKNPKPSVCPKTAIGYGDVDSGSVMKILMHLEPFQKIADSKLKGLIDLSKAIMPFSK
ncbi:uncharacterized protein LOC141904603 [Tubulanus polymorphus]|uniref:uncharacterized protein LOC141904603 n=1 Tax=Tubulanus polymorphus TaxID=672921 RepID=UPI003DA43C4D